MESHAFDNYFSVYCPTVGRYCPTAVTGIPAGTCVSLNPARGATPCVAPFNYTARNLTITSPIPHGPAASLGS